jgi:hypothetical protein
MFTTTADAARTLGTSYVNLYYLIRTGRIPKPSRWGIAFLWTSADLERARAALALVRVGRPRKEVLACA